MKRIKTVFAGVHIGLWILFTMLMALQLSQDPSYRPTLTVGVMGTCLYVFYSHFYILTRYWAKKKRGAYWLRLAIIFATGPLPYLIFHPRRLDTADLIFEYYTTSLLSITVPFLFLGWLARITENLVINTVKKEQLEKGAVEAELYYLKSQMAPHFLFNTLNNIYTLVYKQAPTAPEAVLQLASLMRYMIYESNAPTVPLTRELEYLRDYMGLQQLRYKESPVVDLTIEGEAEACHIAPLLFIHLLENAYTHSPAGLCAGDVKVSVVIKDDTLAFSVQNPVVKNQTNVFREPGGIGLPNISKRLALLYPGQHALEIQDRGETFAVILKIQCLQSPTHERKTHLLYY